MPDCSAVTIQALLPPGTDDEAADKLLIELSEIDNEGGWDWQTKGDGDSSRRGRVLVWENYDCPWGLNTPEEAGLFDQLTKRDMAYIATDYGHYTWTGHTIMWKPGMDDPFEVPSGTEGEEFVHMATLRALVSAGRIIQRTQGVGQAHQFVTEAVTGLLPPVIIGLNT